MPDPTTITQPTETEDNDSLMHPVLRAARAMSRDHSSPSEGSPNSTPHFTPEQAKWIERHMKRVRGEFLVKHLEEQANAAREQQRSPDVGTADPAAGTRAGK